MRWLDQLAESLDPDTETDPKMYGVVSGTVISVRDIMGQGRVQVRIPAIDCRDPSPWARVATIGAGPAAGVYWIPNVGDEVLVAFEQGDLNAPYIVGSLWNTSMTPPLPSPEPQMRMIQSPLGHRIMFTEEPPRIIINTADKQQTIMMSQEGIQIVSGENMIKMTPDGITISGVPRIKLIASQEIEISAPNVTMTGQAATNIGSSTSHCVIKGALVEIN